MDFQGHCLSCWRGGVKCFYLLGVRDMLWPLLIIQRAFPFMWYDLGALFVYGPWNGVWLLFNRFPYGRKEHKSHSPSCHFITLKKKVEELTVEEFFKLQMERHKIIVVRTSGDSPYIWCYWHTEHDVNNSLTPAKILACSCENKRPLYHLWFTFHFLHSQKKSCNEAITKFEEAAKLRRADITKTAMGEEWQKNRRPWIRIGIVWEINCCWRVTDYFHSHVPPPMFSCNCL